MSVSELVEKVRTGEVVDPCVFCQDPVRLDEPFVLTPRGPAHYNCVFSRIQLKVKTKPWGTHQLYVQRNVEYFLTNEV